MKRINPNTNLPFKRGDYREDGFVFRRYGSWIKKDGYNSELWISPNAICKENESDTLRCRLWKSTPKGKATRLISDAKKRGDVTISTEWLTKKLELGICELTGLPFDMRSLGVNMPKAYAPSLDKIDASNKEYSKTNTRVVLFAVNCALGRFGDTYMLPILEAMVKGINKNAK